MKLEDNYREVKADIKNICERIGRNPDDIKIIAVSKSFPMSKIIELVSYGQMDFGENRVRELRDKYYNISFQHEKKLNWHMIGHLQSRKVKDVVAFISLIHSVDSLELAEEIDRTAKKINQVKDILIQINTSDEPQKYGLKPTDAASVCKSISQFSNIRLKGLMTMAKFTENEDEIRDSFRMLKNLYDSMEPDYKDLEYLSMGMSHDYKIALEEGSNMLRIGTAIFGDRTI